MTITVTITKHESVMIIQYHVVQAEADIEEAVQKTIHDFLEKYASETLIDSSISIGR